MTHLLCLSKLSVNKSDGIITLLIDNLGVYLGGLDTRVAKQLRHCVQVGTKCQHHRGKSVATDMEGNPFVDADCFHPFLKNFAH